MSSVRAISLSLLAFACTAQAGTPFEATLVKDLNTTPTASADALRFDTQFAVRGNTLYFNAVESGSGSTAVFGLVRSDGTDAGTQWLPRSAYDAGSVRQIDAFDGGVLFASVDAATSSTAMYHVDADFVQIRSIAGPSTVARWVAGNDALLTYNQPGSTSETDIVHALRAGETTTTIVGDATATGVYQPVGTIGGAMLYFHRNALWRTDGTIAGTVQLANLRPMQDWSVPSPRRWAVQSIVVGDRRYFQACTQASAASCGIYASDGTAPTLLAGVTQRIDLYAPYQSGFAFVAQNQLWISAGTPPSTQQVTTLTNYPMHLVAAGGLLHLIGWNVDPETEYRYHVSDATAAGTREVPLFPDIRINGQPPSTSSAPMLTAYGDDVLFPCSTAAHGQELCVADAAGGGVTAIVDIQPGSISSGAWPVAQTPQAAYFRASDGVHGYELWRVAPQSEALFADDFE
jgi:ELWxxDGT repeat protein